MKSHDAVAEPSRAPLIGGHGRLRFTIAAVLLLALVVGPPGQRSARCVELEAEMHQVIDDYKYDDRDRFDVERRRIEERNEELSCWFSTYRLYTAEGRL